MSSYLLPYIDWGLIAASLFNTIVLLWLGLTVLLNAERRSWGTWVAGGGLLVGAAFFVGHSAIVGRRLGTFTSEMELWWRLGWLVLIGAPYLWYVVMSWYSGALGRPAARRWLAAVSLVGLLALSMLLFADPLPTYDQVVARAPVPLFARGPAPALALIYPVYSVLCTVLALSVLRSPASSERFMGDVARHRARPWLIAASLVLLLASLAVGGAATWVLQQVRQGDLPGLSARVLAAIIVFDLAVCMLIALAVVLIGQAVVAYEIFTGKALPRGELRSQWRRARILAAGYGLAVGWSLSGAGIPQQPIYQLLLATVLMTSFFALLGWRSFEERKRTIGGLRPFVTSQHLYERLLGPVRPASPNGEAVPFQALCDDLLGARVAYLVPLGPLASLAGPPLTTPTGIAAPSHAVATLANALPSEPPLCLAIDPAGHAGAVWAVPLLGERGLIGMLLLGEKRDRGLYTEEEIAIARAASERLIDSQAAAEIARRLAALQRRRLAEGQILDRRTRRLLHDEVLPQVHAAVLQLANGRTRLAQAASIDDDLQAAISNLQAIHRQISDLLHELPPVAGPDLTRRGPLGALRRALDTELATAFDEVVWTAEPAAESAARGLDTLSAEALYYAAREAVRNAARHGRGGQSGRPLHLSVSAAWRESAAGASYVEVAVEDDGVGLATPNSPDSSGAGLALHSTLLAILGGSLSVESAPEGHTRVVLSLPVASSL